MTARDRLVVMVVAVLAVLGAAWLTVVSPERKRAGTVQNEVNAAASQLTAAESQLASARSAQARYSAAYASIVRLGKAVPAGREVPSLVYQLAQASQQKRVDLVVEVGGATGAKPGAAISTPPTFALTTWKAAGDNVAAARGTIMPKTMTFRTWSVGILLAGVLLILQSPGRSQAQDQNNDEDPPSRVARMNYAQGSVSFQPGGEGDWVNAVPNRPRTGH